MNWMIPPVVQVVLVHQASEMTSMQNYVGTKMILAMPMSRQEYNEYRGWEVPKDERGNDAGYLVEYTDGVSNHPEHRGYISWSPKGQFDMAYLNLGQMQGYAPHEQRVIGELAQLEQRLSALQKFTKDDRFLKLHFKTRELMQDQLRVMTRLAFILEERIAGFQRKPVTH